MTGQHQLNDGVHGGTGKRRWARTRGVMFALGCALLILNAAGLFLSLRNPSIHEEEELGFAEDITLPYREFRRQVVRRAGESDAEYIVRLNTVVNRGMAHYWSDAGVTRYHLRVPVWENYLLSLGSLLMPARYQKYEFARVDKAMERGVGLCSQQAMVLARLLQRSGVDASLVGLGGHVVVQARTADGQDFLADPDYGVVMDGPIASLAADTGRVRRHYRGVRFPSGEQSDAEAQLDAVVAAYAPPGNEVLSVPEYFVPKMYYVEHAAYALKWLLPLFLLVPFVLERTTAHRSGARRAGDMDRRAVLRDRGFGEGSGRIARLSSRADVSDIEGTGTAAQSRERGSAR